MMHAINPLRTSEDQAMQNCERAGLVVGLFSRNDDGQRRPARIDKDVPFRTQFATISRIFAGGLTAERGSNTFAVYGLPFPLNPATPVIIVQEQTKEGLKNYQRDPFLIPCMNTTTRPKP